MVDFSERYHAKTVQLLGDEESHNDEFEASFEALNNPSLSEIGFSKDDVIRLLNKKIPPDAKLIDRQNAIAEIAALRPSFNPEYKSIKSSDLIKKLEPLSEKPTHEDRAKRFVWINILNKRKDKADNSEPSEARAKELEQLNQTIGEIRRQLGCMGYEQQLDNFQSKSEVLADGIESDYEKIPAKKVRRGQSEITRFLTDICNNIDINSLNGEKLVRAIKQQVGNPWCPAKKYHGFYNEVCVEWKPGNGSTKCSWGKKAFQNFVVDYKKEKQLKKAVN
jgi:hypothetical protein